MSGRKQQYYLPEVVLIIASAVLIYSGLERFGDPFVPFALGLTVLSLFLIAAFFYRRKSSITTLTVEVPGKAPEPVRDDERYLTLEDDLRTARQRLNFYLANSPMPFIEWNTEFEIDYWNQAAEKMFGFKSEDIIGKRFDLLVPENAVDTMEKMCSEATSQVDGSLATVLNRTADGQVLQCRWRNAPLVGQGGQVYGFASVVENITDRQQAAMRKHRSQKMEALGSLTGGIAHDYNNVLGVILGYAEILKTRLEHTPDLLKYADQIYQAGERGAKLARNLLKFSRQQPRKQAVASLNRLIENDSDMLRQTLTASVDLTLKLDPQLWAVQVDSGGFEDVLLNLCINAKHAMSDGGRLTIETGNCELEGDMAEQLNLPVGSYVYVAIEDTGCGMDEKTLSRIFDPYFSTKGSAGTGLGLSQAYGFVQASGGVIDVFSQPGLGTRFLLYFPRHYQVARQDFTLPKVEGDYSGSETILVVDDEPPLCELVCLILQNNGYRTLAATDAEQALEILSNHAVDLMLSDVIMPKMSGFQLAEKVRINYPDVQIRLASGYHEEGPKPGGHFELDFPVLQKPYDSTDLLSAIREQLDKAKAAQSPVAETPSKNRPRPVSQTDIEWTPTMSVDNGGALDEDHKRLLMLLNQCRQMANDKMDLAFLPEVVAELQHYTEYHFSREELVMKRCDYPKYPEHCKVHKMLITKMKTIVESRNDREVAKWLSEFLSQWLIEHIMVMDKAFVSYIAARKPQVDRALKEFDEMSV